MGRKDILETAEDFYGNLIRRGDTIACNDVGIKLAVVEDIYQATSYGRSCSSLVIRLVKKDGTMAEHTSKQKNSESTVKCATPIQQNNE